MKFGSHDHQKIELVYHGYKTNFIAVKAKLPNSFDIYVDVNVVYREGIIYVFKKAALLFPVL
jgi:hypothetical protein